MLVFYVIGEQTRVDVFSYAVVVDDDSVCFCDNDHRGVQDVSSFSMGDRILSYYRIGSALQRLTTYNGEMSNCICITYLASCLAYTPT